MNQAHIFVTGFVQGVGYRHYIKKNAQKLDLTGWVRNLPDGRVEAVVQGSKEAIAKLLTLCEKGPFLAEVKDITASWEEMKESYNDFTVLTTPTT